MSGPNGFKGVHPTRLHPLGVSVPFSRFLTPAPVLLPLAKVTNFSIRRHIYFHFFNSFEKFFFNCRLFKNYFLILHIDNWAF